MCRSKTAFWIPAFAGMTSLCHARVGGHPVFCLGAAAYPGAYGRHGGPSHHALPHGRPAPGGAEAVWGVCRGGGFSFTYQGQPYYGRVIERLVSRADGLVELHVQAALGEEHAPEGESL